MKYVKLTAYDIVGIEKYGINHIFLELIDGISKREIGFDADGRVLYKYPGPGKFGRHGIMDRVEVILSEGCDCLSADDFNKIFESP